MMKSISYFNVCEAQIAEMKMYDMAMKGFCRSKYIIWLSLTCVFVTKQSLNYDIYLFKIIRYDNEL